MTAEEDKGNSAFESALGRDAIYSRIYATEATIQEIRDALNALGYTGIEELVDSVWNWASLSDTAEISTSVFVLAVMLLLFPTETKDTTTLYELATYMYSGSSPHVETMYTK